MIKLSLADLVNILYYSFKIFPQFWLAKSTRVIHHNQLMMTKFGRILCLRTRKWRQKCSSLQVKKYHGLVCKMKKIEIPQRLSQQSPLETILGNKRLSLFDFLFSKIINLFKFSPSRGLQTTEKWASYPCFVNGKGN